MVEKNRDDKKQQLYMTFLLVIIALVAVSAATVAWFTIADNTKVNSMDMNVTSGVSLRFDLDPHATFDEYVRTLSFADIANRIQRDKQFDMRKTPLVPVTTNDCVRFSYEDGKLSESTSGDYLEFTLNFMATEDMVVHLTSADSTYGGKGTLVSSKNPSLPSAMRISFTVDGRTYIYDPGIGDTASTTGNLKTFGLPVASKMVYSDNNALFDIKKDVNVPVVVHIWMEGTDEACNNELRGSDYAITMRFEGTDKDNKLLVEPRQEKKTNEKDQ